MAGPRRLRMYNSSARTPIDYGNWNADPRMPTGAVAETFSRMGTAMASSSVSTTGVLHLTLVLLRSGNTATNIVYNSSTTAAVAPTNWWFSLHSYSTRAKLGQTADQTSTAWAANTEKSLALTTPYVVTTTGLYYVGFMMAAGTVCSLICTGSSSLMNYTDPITTGTSTTGLTTTAPDPAGALSAIISQPYVYIT